MEHPGPEMGCEQIAFYYCEGLSKQWMLRFEFIESWPDTTHVVLMKNENNQNKTKTDFFSLVTIIRWRAKWVET